MQQEILERLHARYLVQATWTTSIREQLFDSIQIQGKHKLLEVGSGTGAGVQTPARTRASGGTQRLSSGWLAGSWNLGGGEGQVVAECCGWRTLLYCCELYPRKYWQ